MTSFEFPILTDTEGKTSVESFPSPRTPFPGGPAQVRLKSNYLSADVGATIYFGYVSGPQIGCSQRLVTYESDTSN